MRGVEILLEAGDVVVLDRADENGRKLDRPSVAGGAAQHVLLHESALRTLSADVLVAQVRHAADEPAKHAKVFVDRLLEVVEIVPDARVGRIDRPHRVDVTRDDRRDQPFRELEAISVHGPSFIQSIAVAASSPKRMRPTSSSVAGATIMCCVTTWTSRKQRWSGELA